jgi:8-oxo-dGTP pyrophosphatase MutT (NUDIX family)
LRERAGTVVVHDGRMLMVRLEDPVSGVTRLFPPGGRVEVGEDPAACAARETLEETGYAVAVDEATHVTVDYPYEWAGVLVPCRTHFYRARLKDGNAAPADVNDASYHRGVEWIGLDEVAATLAYHDVIADGVRRCLGWPALDS